MINQTWILGKATLLQTGSQILWALDHAIHADNLQQPTQQFFLYTMYRVVHHIGDYTADILHQVYQNMTEATI